MTDSGKVLDGDALAREEWSHDNDRGLALAADGDWAGAMEAFSAASDALAQDLPLRPATHEPLALVLGNLAHACYRAGAIDAAIQHAQRTCALRVAIAGEDGMPTSRARMDLAVMLASTGRADEAITLAQRTIASIEHRVGEEDVRLAVVLENAARIALALGSPSTAEPLLLRLHALLHAHGLSTGRAEHLLAKVADVRDRQRFTPRSRTPVSAERLAPSPLGLVPTPSRSTAIPSAIETLTTQHLVLDDLEPFAPDDEPFAPSFTPGSSLTPTEASLVPAAHEYAHASIGGQAEWEDQPLRDAVRVTDGLLRATPPSGEPVVMSTTRLDLDRGHTLAMPTPGRGVVAIETPSRGGRAVSAAAPARQRTPERTASEPVASAPKAAAPAPARSVELPMIIGSGVTLVVAGAAVWWLLLR